MRGSSGGNSDQDLVFIYLPPYLRDRIVDPLYLQRLVDECARSVVEDVGKPKAEVGEGHELLGESRKAPGHAR